MNAAAALLLGFLLLFPAPAAAAPPLRVLASFLPMYLFTENVVRGAPGVSVDLMLPAALGCPHDYALTPGDMRKIAAADIFVANGLGMEEFLGAPVRKANPRIRVVETARDVPPLRGVPGGESPGGINPHAWVSPRNAILQVRAIEAALSAARPGLAAVFRRNADAYAKTLRALAAEGDRDARSYRRRNIVAFHGIFGYLARDLGLRVVGEIETAPGQEPSAGEIRALVRTIRADRVPAIFGEPQYPAKIARTVADEAGVPVRILDPVATGSPAPSTYEDVMRRNFAILREILGAP